MIELRKSCKRAIIKAMNDYINKTTVKYCIVALLSLFSAVAILRYLENPIFSNQSSSFIVLLLWFFFFKAWNLCLEKGSKRFFAYNGVFTFLFSICMTIGRKLDLNLQMKGAVLFLLIIGLFCAVFPIVSIISRKLLDYKANGSNNNGLRQFCFWFIVVTWILGYLAVFPGIYATDAFTWYLEFDDPAKSVSSQWSPVYAYLFYKFVHTGYVLFNNYEYGFAAFIAIQSIFVLIFGINSILLFVQNRMGDKACVLTTLFFALVPTHMIMTMHAAQGTPFMVCFAIILMHLYRMIDERDEYWCNFKNYGSFIFWGTCGCIFRNNAYYVFILMLVSTLFVNNSIRKRIFLTFLAVVVLMTFYKGPLLDLAGVSKGTALREALSMPLQQMACAYVQYSHKMTKEQKALLEKYVPPKALNQYPRDSGISDVQKRNLNLNLVREDFKKFIKLYLNIGINSPVAYLKAAYMQNLGMLYIDKQYQDTRIWHNYLDYVNYDGRKSNYIIVERKSLFPAYERVLSKLFGRLKFKNVVYFGYAGHTSAVFSSIPILSIFCRASSYFWCLFYFLLFAAYKKYREDFLYLSFAAIFTLSVIFSPVVLYRYYAPVIFAFPVIIAALLGTRKNELKL